MFGNGKHPDQPALTSTPAKLTPVTPANPPLLTVVGENARMEGKFDITDSIQIECDVGGEINVGGKLVIGEKGVVHANVQTADAIIMGQYEGNMTATGEVEIAETGRVSGNITTDSLVILKGGFFNGTVVKLNENGVRQVVPIEEKLGTHHHGR
ncbi:MAG TPA: polymer-forming cytoskeletal protein [Gemmatimonadaceae bacterium]|jgi:cytoskeletal protein CcmA (bactofilin family)